MGVNSGKHNLRKRKSVISLTANSQDPNLPRFLPVRIPGRDFSFFR